MSYPKDQQFIGRLKLLIEEVLKDEARYLDAWYNRRADKALEFESLHTALFQKTTAVEYQQTYYRTKLHFSKYFYSTEGGAQVKQDVPFADSRQDQEFFFNQMRGLVRMATMNFDPHSIGFIIPHIVKKEGGEVEARFDDNQNRMVYMNLLMPFMGALEQREIAKLEESRKPEAERSNQEPPIKENPYEGQDKKILVQDINGAYSVILTYTEIEELAHQHQKFISENNLKGFLDYVRGNFKNIFVDDQGRIVTFQNGLGKTMEELLLEMKTRQARQVQFQAILASDGHLGLTDSDFQVRNSDGMTTTVNGLDVRIDQGGQGQNAVFFLKDESGSQTRILINIATFRQGQDPEKFLRATLYTDPKYDDPLSPRVSIPLSSLDTGKEHPSPLAQASPIRKLYQNSQIPRSTPVTPGMPRIPLPPLPIEAPIFSPVGELSPGLSQGKEPLEINVPVSFAVSIKPGEIVTPKPKLTPAPGKGSPQPPYKPISLPPHIRNLLPAPVRIQTGVGPDTQAGKAAGEGQEQATKPKIQAPYSTDLSETQLRQYRERQRQELAPWQSGNKPASGWKIAAGLTLGMGGATFIPAGFLLMNSATGADATAQLSAIFHFISSIFA